MPPLRARPALHPLEARETPALTVAFAAGSLTLSGVPTAGPAEKLLVQHVGDHNYHVTDGPTDLGTYRVTQDVRFRLTGFDTRVVVDLVGDTLGGSIVANIGAGDTDPSTLGLVGVGSSAGDATVRGDVTFRGGSGQERFALGGALTVGGSVRALANPVSTPVEDTLDLGRTVRVRGDVVTARVTYTTVNGTVDGNVIANTVDSPGGMGFAVNGTVGGNVTAVGGATAPPGADGTRYYSFANITGTVAGDAIVRFTDGVGQTRMTGRVSGNYRLTCPALAAGGGAHSASTHGRVEGDTSLRTAGSIRFDLFGDNGGGLAVSAAGGFATGELDGFVGGDFRFTAGPATRTDLAILGAVGGDAAIDLGGAAGTSARFTLYDDYGDRGRVGGDLTIRGRAGTTSVQLGQDGLAATVGGDLRVDLGDGTNTFALDASASVGGGLSYTGGAGVDTVSLAGRHTFVARIRTGDGNDTVTFAPDAVVGAIDIDFGGGTDAWTPPNSIDFPTALRNLP